MTSQRSGTVSLSRARYGVLAELYIVLIPLFSFRKVQHVAQKWRMWWMITRFSKMRLNLGRDEGD